MKNVMYYKWLAILGIFIISCTEDEDSLFDSPTVEEEIIEAEEKVEEEKATTPEIIEEEVKEEVEVAPIEEISDTAVTDEMEASEETTTEMVPNEFSILNINPVITGTNSFSIEIRLESSNATLFDVVINEEFTIRNLRVRPSIVATVGETIGGDGLSDITFDTDDDGTIIFNEGAIRLAFSATLPENLRPAGENTITVIAKNSFGNTTSTNTLEF